MEKKRKRVASMKKRSVNNLRMKVQNVSGLTAKCAKARPSSRGVWPFAKRKVRVKRKQPLRGRFPLQKKTAKHRCGGTSIRWDPKKM